MNRAVRKISAWLAVLALGTMTAMAGGPPSPFQVSGSMATNGGSRRLVFHFEVPPEHVLYADRLAFLDADGNSLKPSALPEPVLHRNQQTGQERLGYEHPFLAELDPGQALPWTLTVKFQGCSNTACYFPEKHLFTVTAAGVSPADSMPVSAALAAAGNEKAPVLDTNGFRVVAKETGYVAKQSFLAFLSRAREGQGNAGGLGGRLSQAGPVASFLLILAGGIGLNLTPCVLPLIPINLAIIGAGARAKSRRRGFALGAAYGLGMAVAYGALGLVVVITGAKFGTLNSSPWFNLGIALVFLAMALAMFDWVNIDFSRFQNRMGGASHGSETSQFALAFSMGSMAALLAGACVAPVVISVLLLAAQFYAKGNVTGLMLPFLLGLGMAAPWPFAGAGLSFLPKPGKWMKHVKYGFGVLIVLFAGYYGHLAVGLFRPSSNLKVLARTPNHQAPAPTPEAALEAALNTARAERRPVFIDFAASWCKNCEAMDATVFNAAEVKEKLRDFVVVRYDAEKPNASPAREVLDRFGVMGLPTYVVLLPEK